MLKLEVPAYRPLGSYRLLLAMFVVIGHFLQALAPGESEWYHLPYGTVGVMCFFLVSGYVISEASQTFYENSPGRFAINRLIRIFVPYWFALIVTALVIAALYFLQSSGRELLQDWSAGSFIVTTCLPWTIIAPLDYSVVLGAEPCFVIVRYIWAVVVEMQFYLVVAITLLLGKFVGLKRAAQITAGSAIVLYLASTTIGWAPIHSITYSPYFLAGFLMHAMSRSTFRLPVATVLLAWIAFDFWSKVKGNILPLETTALMVASTAVFIALCWRTCSDETEKADRYMGDLSYPVYLHHYAVEIVFAALLVASWPSLAFALVAVLAVSVAAKGFVEPRIANLRAKFRGSDLRLPPRLQTGPSDSSPVPPAARSD